MSMKSYTQILLTLVFLSSSIANYAQLPLKLWYNSPANSKVPDDGKAWASDSAWLKALPVGNGHLGAMIYGDVHQERIQLNEKTLWSGSPDDNDNPQAVQSLSKIRQLLFEGKYKEANQLNSATQICKGAGSGHGEGSKHPYGTYQTLGDLYFDFGNKAAFTHYHKELDLNRAVVTISYRQNGVNFKREIFASYPDHVLVMRLSADRPQALNFNCQLNRPERFRTYAEADQVLMTGKLSDGKGGDGLSYATRLKAINKGGQITYDDKGLSVQGADEVVLLLTAATNYQQEYQNFLAGKDPLETTAQFQKNALKRSYAKLLERHLLDYQSLFNRVQLGLTSPEKEAALPTNLLLQDPDNLHLHELYFQFGRYLLIASSREGTLPANLQGIWSNKIQTPWNGDYHININLQMNYWPADLANLSDCYSPFTDLVESLVKPGEKSASVQYNAQGWCAQVITNIWGYTAPGEETSWGMYAVGGAWLSHQLWDHYLFTQDVTYLKRVYPILLKSAAFFLDWLVQDPENGKWVSGPSTSPENRFVAPDGSRVSISMGPAHDQQIIQELFSATLAAAAVLGDKNALLDKIENVLPNLEQPRIGKDGRLMEWREEFVEVEPTHRHVSHLFMLHPGAQIDPLRTPELALAARKSLEARTDIGTGWSLAWKVNFWARLLDGERAYRLLKNLLYSTKEYSVQMSSAGGTYQNLFCGHPPFQIDGNLGGTAGIAEMLLQSHLGEIHLLPAIPQAWNEGEVKGLKARGGFEVSMKWANGYLRSGSIKANNAQEMVIRTKNPIQLEGGKLKSISVPGGYLLTTKVSKNKVYKFTAAGN